MATALKKRLIERGFSEIVARIVAGRIDQLPENIDQFFFTENRKMPFANERMKGIDTAVERIKVANKRCQRIGILTDYDVDGITAHAIIYETLVDIIGVPKEKVQHIIGHRLTEGYGVSEKLVDRILSAGKKKYPHLIITADCGSSDELQIKRLKEAGIDVIVTDHHIIPPEGVPVSAVVTVNPNQTGCSYPDKEVAGCFVAWFLMCHLRSKIATLFDKEMSDMASFLDLVALGSVADVVSLFSPVNRYVIKNGLKRINDHKPRGCFTAYRMLTGNDKPLTVTDLGFGIGPRINAQSRMNDPYEALSYVLLKNAERSLIHLKTLDDHNSERKQVERKMTAIAMKRVNNTDNGHVIYHDTFHAGVQGIVASRIVEKTGKPTVIFSPRREDASTWTGSCRSIPKIHIKDALDYVSVNSSGVLLKYGGHSGAAGVTIKANRLLAFQDLFNEAIDDQLEDNETLGPVLLTDGNLDPEDINIETFHKIERLQPFGRGFEAPVFSGKFFVDTVTAMGNPKIHLRLALRQKNKCWTAVWFRALDKETDDMPVNINQYVQCAYTLNQNEWNGNTTLQLIIQELTSL